MYNKGVVHSDCTHPTKRRSIALVTLPDTSKFSTGWLLKMVYSKLFIPKIHVWKALPEHVSQASAVAKALKTFHLKAAKKVELKFDPFHPNVSSIRDFLAHTSADAYRQTNAKCIFKTNICSDRSEPLIAVTLEDNRKLIFKTENLKITELLILFNKHVSSLYKPPVEEPLKTKTSKFKRR